MDDRRQMWLVAALSIAGLAVGWYASRRRRGFSANERPPKIFGLRETPQEVLEILEKRCPKEVRDYLWYGKMMRSLDQHAKNISDSAESLLLMRLEIAQIDAQLEEVRQDMSLSDEQLMAAGQAPHHLRGLRSNWDAFMLALTDRKHRLAAKLDEETRRLGNEERIGVHSRIGVLKQYSAAIDALHRCAVASGIGAPFLIHEKKRARKRSRLHYEPLSTRFEGRDVLFGVELEMEDPSVRSESEAFDHGQRVLGKALKVQAKREGLYRVRAQHETGTWLLVPDVSVAEHRAAFELCTPALRLQDMEVLKKVVRAMRDAGMQAVPVKRPRRQGGTLTAGMHVHVSHPSQSRRMGLILRQMAALDDTVERAQWRQQYARRLPPGMKEKFGPHLSPELAKALWEAELGKTSDRHWGINIQALRKHGTVEVRAFDGTLDPEEVRRRVLLAVKAAVARMNGRAARAGGNR